MSLKRLAIASAVFVAVGAIIVAATQKYRSVSEVERLPAPTLFADCEVCPPMLTVPSGTFHMGRQLRKREALHGVIPMTRRPPLRTVSVEAFALARTEVTIAQWRACTLDGACRDLSDTLRNVDDAHPVTNVSWYDAQTYANWLTSKTGVTYRLPSEAEWEYAARAGTRTPFSWGREAKRDYANFGGEMCPPCSGETGGRDRWLETAPVGQFPPNPFGLNDMHGNVYEWTQDCLSALEPKQVTAAPVETDDCSQRVMRGGAWHNDPRRIQVDYRAHNPPTHGDEAIGFRVARVLR